MFKDCKSLISLRDISKWDTSKVDDMSNMFNECISLESLPDNQNGINLILKVFLIYLKIVINWRRFQIYQDGILPKLLTWKEYFQNVVH